MSDFRIRPPGAPTADAARGVGREGGAATGGGAGAEGVGAKAFELNPWSAAAPAQEAAPAQPATPVEPSSLVQRIRAGEIDVDRAVEIIVDQALAAQPALPEAMRREARRAMIELVRDDPTLAALASAMRR